QLKSGCGINVILDSTLVADRITNTSTITFQSHEVRPLWLSIAIPQDIKPGTYSGQLLVTIKSTVETKKISLPYTLEITNQTLQQPKDWDFHLDLWQNPYSSARYYGLEVFSKAHLEKLDRICNAWLMQDKKI